MTPKGVAELRLKMEEDPGPSLCPICSQQLVSYFVNLSESIAMCPEPSCTYPFGVTKILNNHGSSQPIQITREPPRNISSTVFTDASNSSSNSSKSCVSSVASIRSPVCSDIAPSQKSSSAPMISRVLDCTESVEQNLNLNDSLPMVDSSFLDDLCNPAPGSDVLNELVANFAIPSASGTATESATLVSKTTFEKPFSEEETIAYYASIPSVSNVTNTVTTSSSPILSNISLESRTITVPCAPQFSNKIIINTNESTFVPNELSGDGLPVAPNSATTEVTAIRSGRVLSQKLFPQWKNKDSFCWLDVSMNLLTHCDYLRRFAASLPTDNLLVSLLNTYKHAIELTMDKRGKGIRLETSLGHVVVKTGGGQSPRKMGPLSALVAEAHPLVYAVPVEVSEETNVINALLNEIRETLWRYLQPKLGIARGTHDSPVFALPLLLGLKEVKQEFVVSYTWQMVCCHCRHHHKDKVEKIMPTFPNVPSDFSMLAPCFVRSCFKCNAKKQRINMVFDRLPPVVFIHFVEGISATSLEELDFQYQGSNYRVTGVVQYRLDHFVCWLRHHKEELWMKCDDLEGRNTSFTEEKPNFPTKEVHVVMWEVIGECLHLKNQGPEVPQPNIVSIRPGVTPQATLRSFTKMEKSNTKPVPRETVTNRTLPTLPSATVKQQQITTTKASVVRQMAPPVSGELIPLNPGFDCGMTKNTVQGKKAPVDMQPNIGKFSPAVAVAPAKSTSTKKNASDERLQKIRDRLKQLKAANAQRAGLKQGTNSYPNGTMISPTPQAYPGLVPRQSTPAVTPVTGESASTPSGSRQKSYLAALQPFLQSKVELSSMSNTGTKHFTGYMTKAEREAATKAQRKQDEQLASLLAETKSSSSRKANRSKAGAPQLTSSPKKSVRFTGDAVQQPGGIMKRRLDNSPSSPLKIFKSGYTELESFKRRKNDSIPRQKRAIRDKLCTSKVSIPEKSKGCQNNLSNKTNKPNIIIPHNGVSDRELANTTGSITQQMSNDAQVDLNSYAKEASVISELLDALYSNDVTSNQNPENNTPDDCNGSLASPDPETNLTMHTLNFDDTDFLSMPSFF